MNSLIAIPDIHGRWDKLENLIGTLCLLGHTLDNLVFLGDFIDRGPDSAKVIDWLMKYKQQYPQTVILRGNHEEMLLNYLETGNEVWFRANNGGLATLDSYRRFLKAELRNPLEFQKALRQNGHWEFIRKLPYYWETEEYFFSHAPIPLEKYWPGGLKPATTLPYPAELYCWATPGQIPEEKYAQVHPGKYAVCGHVHRLREQIFSARAYTHICYLDAGCGCHVNAPLAALILPERRIFYSL